MMHFSVLLEASFHKVDLYPLFEDCHITEQFRTARFVGSTQSLFKNTLILSNVTYIFIYIYLGIHKSLFASQKVLRYLLRKIIQRIQLEFCMTEPQSLVEI